jgi:large subunit ribosomal protein L3
MKSIIGRKIGMTSVFAEDGTQYPVSVIEVLPNAVVQKKTIDKEGYDAVVVGFEDKKKVKNVTKGMKGIFDKAKVTPKEGVYELKGDEVCKYNVGDNILCTIFAAGENVDVTGVSKGRGYSGVIARFHETIGPKAHGSGFHRQIGSLANNGRTNNRVLPGKVMSGQWGHEFRTTLNLTVIGVYPEKNCILIKGSVPGPNKSIVRIRTAVKAPNLKHEVKPLVNHAVVAAKPAAAVVTPVAEPASTAVSAAEAK